MVKLSSEHKYFIWFHDESLQLAISTKTNEAYDTFEEATAEAELIVTDDPGLTYDIIEQEISFKSVRCTRKAHGE